MSFEGFRLQQTEEKEQTGHGRLQVYVTSTLGMQPIPNASVQIFYTAAGGDPLESAVTDTSGQTGEIVLNAPPLEYSMEPDRPQPYAEYTVRVQAEGYRPVEVSGIEVFPNEVSIENIRMQPVEVASGVSEEDIVIPPNVLWGDYPPKIAENEIKPLDESGEIVLSRVVIPEYMVVHDGPPSDVAAKDYYVRYRDYIKNVASGEVYATWPDAALRANILAIMSFSLNRVYTEWYRNQGYDFTITSSTAYDQTWSYGRNIFGDISRIVDEIFNCYLSRPNVRQPLFTQYCDGKNVTCPNWLSQWGSKYLADQGYSAIEILRYYYGSDIYINSAEEIAGVPASWPGESLSVGSSGSKVRQIQQQLATIARSYPAIPELAADGIYGRHTRESVEAFQRIFDLPVTGVIDFATWYKISQIYVGVTRIAEGL